MKKNMMKTMTLILIWFALITVPAFSATGFDSEKETLDFDTTFYVIDRFGDPITEASQAFNIPRQVLVRVIATTSGGDPLAETKGAKGLMMVTEKVFAQARQALADEGIAISDNPLDPRASIFAGAWHLSRIVDNPPERSSERDLMASGKKHLNWETAMAFYAARAQVNKLPAGDKGFD